MVGAGFAAKFHMTNIPANVAEVTSVFSPRPESREAFARDYGLKPYESYEAMLADVDAVDICSPPSSHAEQIRLAVQAGVHVAVEKPFTGFFGSPAEHSKQAMLDGVVKELSELRAVVAKSGVILGYAENCVYAPSIQKEREVIEKTKAQILRMTGEESHNGSHSPVYGIWSVQGGGSLIAKGCHPLTPILYLKRKEGMARLGRPIRPKAVSARTHTITKLESFADAGFLRTSYQDTEDYAFLHVIFEDGMVADVTASELVLGGIHDYVEVFANNHRTRCHISPVRVNDVYAPNAEVLKDIYFVEKISQNAGWITCSGNDNWANGREGELADILGAMAAGREPECGFELAMDTTVTLYAGYASAEKKGAEVEVPLL
jgi:predicted dehydrogenase